MPQKEPLMRFSRTVVACALALAGGLPACGGSTGGGDNASCSLGAGAYTLHFAPEASSNSTCPTLPDKTETVAATEGPSAFVASSMTAPTTMDAGSDCTTSTAGCSVTANCSIMGDGVSAQISADLTLGTNTVSGTETIAESNNGTTLTCKYDVTWTKL
jgi:hypothetical protein